MRFNGQIRPCLLALLYETLFLYRRKQLFSIHPYFLLANKGLWLPEVGSVRMRTIVRGAVRNIYAGLTFKATTPVLSHVNSII